MKSVNLNSNDYHSLIIMVSDSIKFWSDFKFEDEKISYLKDLKKKLEEHFYEAYKNEEEINNDE